MADGNCKACATSPAAASSGLITIASPSSSLIKSSSVLYSGLRTLAIVWQFPAFFAIRQHSRLSSSEPVTAISRSADSIPASICTEYVEPFPTTPIKSFWLVSSCTSSSRQSITVISLSSLPSSSANDCPTLPSPTIIIFMICNSPLKVLFCKLFKFRQRSYYRLV